MTDNQLIEQARIAMQTAYAPYSNYQVGAALLCSDGTLYRGCNIENASFGVTNCAERTALFKAVSEGKRNFTAIAVVGGKDRICSDYAMPCGICRQALAEFCGQDFRILLWKENGSIKQTTLKDLLPGAFHL